MINFKIPKFTQKIVPGTIILADGRGSNCEFLRLNFKRKWKYINDYKSDQHIFCLNDPSIGKYNKIQLDFYNKR